MSSTSGIKDKVQFWQEQDKINQALIPRVMKLHELVTDLSQAVEGTSASIANAESRAVQKSREHAQEVQQEIEATIETREKAVRSDVEEHVEAIKTEVDGLRADVDSIESRFSKSASYENTGSSSAPYTPTQLQMYMVYGMTALALCASVFALVLAT